MMTIRRTSAMPMAPTSRRSTKRNIRKRNQYMTVPRMNSSSIDFSNPNSCCQSSSNIAVLLSVPRTPCSFCAATHNPGGLTGERDSDEPPGPDGGRAGAEQRPARTARGRSVVGGLHHPVTVSSERRSALGTNVNVSAFPFVHALAAHPGGAAPSGSGWLAN
jgi:hypothetical protein